MVKTPPGYGRCFYAFDFIRANLKVTLRFYIVFFIKKGIITITHTIN